MLKTLIIILISIILYACCSCFSLGLYVNSDMFDKKNDLKRGKQILTTFLLGPFSIIWFFLFKLFKVSFKFGKNTAKNINNKKVGD